MQEDAGLHLSELKVDGGASANNFLMQFQSDVIHTPVLRPGCIETTALGAAYLAGLAVGFWADQAEIVANGTTFTGFEPQMDEETRQERLRGWSKAVGRSLKWAE